MKQLIILAAFSPFLIFGQKETKVNAPITKVTVFSSGAQIEHTREASLSGGKQIVVFEKLTDFVDPASIQLKSSQNATILSVRTRKNFDDKAIAQQEVDAMNVKKKTLTSQERKLRDEYSVLLSDEDLLARNNYLGSQQQTVKITELKEASVFFHSKLTDIRNRKSVIEDELETIIRSINSIEQEITTRRSLPVKNYTEIEVEMDVEKSGPTDFTFSYITPNASWKPYYDMRSNGIGAPVLLEAKGLVAQSTGMDWNGVQLVLSTNDPYDNTQEPIIEPWFLNYYSPLPKKQITGRAAPVYNYSGETVFGEVIDTESGEPLPFAKISMSQNPQLVYTTDIDGRYSFVVPRGETAINVSYLGYDNAYIAINAPFTKVFLNPQDIQLEEVVVSSYSMSSNAPISADEISRMPAHDTKLFSGRKRNRRSDQSNEMEYYAPAPVAAGSYSQSIATTVEKDLRMEFQINTPFTVPSDNADHRVAIATYNLTANYEYHAVPKLDPATYLVAQVSGWEKLNLLNGESNLYFDGTFIGKSYVNVQSAKDTLSFSLGKDKKVVVERKRSEEKSKTRLLGSRNKYEVQWDFTVRNNGAASIPFIMKDHFPVSVNEDIKVKRGTYAGATLDDKTGILTWKFNLNKGETKKFSFDYSVDYGSAQPVYLE